MREREHARESERVRKNEKLFGRFTAREIPRKFSERTIRLKQGITLFIDNITTRMTRGWMEDIVKYECGKGLLGVYVSFKCRKNSTKLFGFIRFEGRREARMAINKLNGLMVGGNRLKVSYARFEKSLESGKRPDTRQSNSARPQHNLTLKVITIPKHKRGLMDGRSFVEVLKQCGKGYNVGMTQHEDDKIDRAATAVQKEWAQIQPDITVVPEKEKLDWLRRSVVGFTKNGVTGLQVIKSLEESRFQCKKIIPWGDHKILVTSKEGADLKEMVKQIKNLCEELLEGVRQWKEEDTTLAGSDGFWFSCVGVPIQCWSDHTFDKIGSIWGRVLEIDTGKNFDNARILLEWGGQADSFTKKLRTAFVYGNLRFPIRLTTINHTKGNKEEVITKLQSEADDKGKEDAVGCNRNRELKMTGKSTMMQKLVPETKLIVENLNSLCLSAHATNKRKSNTQRRLEATEETRGGGKASYVADPADSGIKE